MTGSIVAERGRSRPDPRRKNDKYDEALFAAKNRSSIVTFYMAQEIEHVTDEECAVDGSVVTVGRYSVEIEISGRNRRVWLAKPMIMATEVWTSSMNPRVAK
jgi:hypothetical protein